MSLPKYLSYSDSGVDWLGEVPAHWEIVPLKHVAEFTNGAAFMPTEWSDTGYPIIRIENLNGGTDFNFFSGEIGARYFVEDGDLLFGWSGNRGTSFGPFLWKHDGVCVLNQHIFRVESQRLSRKALYWTLKAVTARVEDQAHGIIGMVHITKSHLGSIRVPLAPPSEIEVIVNFLDRETAKIDALVAEQRRLVELLKEKRQAVISHAVTKGLDPNAKMKPSGIEWLGDVPKHWEVLRLKYVCPQVTVGIVIEPSKYYTPGGVPALRSLNVTPGKISLLNLVYISQEANELHAKSRLSVGDLVAVRSGQPGTTAVIPPELDGCNCVDLIIIRKPMVGSEHFLCWYLASDVARIQFMMGSGGAIQQHFNVATAGELIVTQPPTEEQRAIDDSIRTKTTRLDELTLAAEHMIELLQERRTALISAAVTGKIDVRHLASQMVA